MIIKMDHIIPEKQVTQIKCKQRAVRVVRFNGTVNCVKFNEESTVILSGLVDGSVKAWDCRSRNINPLQSMDDPKDSVTAIEVSDQKILVGSADGCIRRYVRMGKLFVDLIGKSVTCVNFTRDGQCVLASTLDNTIRLMDKDTGEMLNDINKDEPPNLNSATCNCSQMSSVCAETESCLGGGALFGIFLAGMVVGILLVLLAIFILKKYRNTNGFRDIVNKWRNGPRTTSSPTVTQETLSATPSRIYSNVNDCQSMTTNNGAATQPGHDSGHDRFYTNLIREEGHHTPEHAYSDLTKKDNQPGLSAKPIKLQEPLPMVAKAVSIQRLGDGMEDLYINVEDEMRKGETSKHNPNLDAHESEYTNANNDNNYLVLEKEYSDNKPPDQGKQSNHEYFVLEKDLQNN